MKTKASIVIITVGEKIGAVREKQRMANINKGIIKIKTPLGDSLLKEQSNHL